MTIELKEQDNPILQRDFPAYITLTPEQGAKITRLNLGMEIPLMLRSMKEFDVNEFIDYYLDVWKGLAVGGGMLIDFMRWKEAKQLKEQKV